MKKQSAWLGLILFFSISVQAYPNIGDKVQWTGTLTQQDGKSLPVRITKEIIQHDEPTNKWKIKYEVSLGLTSATKIIDEELQFNQNTLKEILKTCVEKGGQREEVSTSAGKYQTCRLKEKTPDGFVIEKWWGDIPFGVVGKTTIAPSAKPLDAESLLVGL